MNVPAQKFQIALVITLILFATTTVYVLKTQKQNAHTTKIVEPKIATSTTPTVDSVNALAQPVFVGAFVKAAILEGSSNYTFVDEAHQTKTFVSDNAAPQKLPFNFFDEEANTNQFVVGTWFKIVYSTSWEQRGESEEKILVNKILHITRIQN